MRDTGNHEVTVENKNGTDEELYRINKRFWRL